MIMAEEHIWQSFIIKISNKETIRLKQLKGSWNHLGKNSSYQNSLSPVEPIDHVILRLKLFDALIDISKFLFD